MADDLHGGTGGKVSGSMSTVATGPPTGSPPLATEITTGTPPNWATRWSR
ncbi:MAG TPA: hypothetical protein VIT65_02555 [Microlunatus sp.]